MKTEKNSQQGLAKIVGNAIVLNGKEIYTNSDLDKDRKLAQNSNYIVWSESFFDPDFWGDGRYNRVKIKVFDREGGKIKDVYSWSDGEHEYRSHKERYLDSLELPDGNVLSVTYHEYEGGRGLIEKINLKEVK
jgi:hypothetical protein